MFDFFLNPFKSVVFFKTYLNKIGHCHPFCQLQVFATCSSLDVFHSLHVELLNFIPVRHISSLYYKELQRDLIIKSTFSMHSFHDCERLSVRMSEEGFAISAHTLARFFGILPPRRTYPSTLNLMCRFLGFEDFGSFVEIKRHSIEGSLLRDDAFFSDTSFSVYGFELALRLCDESLIRTYLEAIVYPHDRFYELSQSVGAIVRCSPHRNRLLELFASFPVGRALFFESFVDEDDPDGYYSLALEKYYLRNSSSPNSKIFTYAFLICRSVYKGMPINEDWVTFFKRETQQKELFPWFFHEASRIMETELLIDWCSGALSKSKVYVFLERCLNQLKQHDTHASKWILARTLKALSKTGWLGVAINYPPFRSVLLNIHSHLAIDSIGALIVQFINHCCFKDELEPASPPLAVKNRGFLNESITRLSVESVTRLIYASDLEYKHLSPSFTAFSKMHGTDWLLEPLNMIKNKSK